MAAVVPGRVSVIIPCYNASSFIRRAVESVLSQTYKDVELVIIDDCSTDNLQAALDSYQGRFVYSRNPANVGTSGSRNNGAAIATGEMLAFLDQDDWWPEDLLTRLVPECATGTVACYDNYVLSEADLTQSEAVWKTRATVLAKAKPWDYDQISWDTMDVMFQGAPMLKILINHENFVLVGGYDTRFDGVEDFYFLLKLLASKVKLRIIPEVKGYYLDHADSTSAAIRTDKTKQTKSCAVWLLMNRVMPRELCLSPAAVESCRRGEKYWAMRSTDLLLGDYVRQKQFAQVFTPAFLSKALPTLPALAAQKAANFFRIIRGRLR